MTAIARRSTARGFVWWRRRPRRGAAPADPAPGRLVAEERLRPRQDPTREAPPALAVAHRRSRSGSPRAASGPVEPARGGRRRPTRCCRPATLTSGRAAVCLRRPGDGHRRRRVRQDPDDGGAGGLRRPPPRHAARGGRLHHLHEQRPPRRSGNGRATACRACSAPGTATDRAWPR